MKSKPLIRGPEAPSFAYRGAITMADWPAIRALVLKTGVFNDREVEGVRELMDDTVNRPAWGNYRFWVAEADGVIAGFTCVSPIHGTLDRFDMYWLAVDPDFHGAGCALRLVALAIDGIRAQGGKKLYVETSIRPSYEQARRFYLRAGFILEGTLPDYYADGDGKAIFSTRI
jgi:ribosomal protein S18 acetylase RimI-like enzyme